MGVGGAADLLYTAYCKFIVYVAYLYLTSLLSVPFVLAFF